MTLGEMHPRCRVSPKGLFLIAFQCPVIWMPDHLASHHTGDGHPFQSGDNPTTAAMNIRVSRGAVREYMFFADHYSAGMYFGVDFLAEGGIFNSLGSNNCFFQVVVPVSFPSAICECSNCSTSLLTAPPPF